MKRMIFGFSELCGETSELAEVYLFKDHGEAQDGGIHRCILGSVLMYTIEVEKALHQVGFAWQTRISEEPTHVTSLRVVAFSRPNRN